MSYPAQKTNGWARPLEINSIKTRKSHLGWTDIAICTLIIVTTLSVYFQVKNFEFISYDTPEYVYENKYVAQGLSAEGIKWALTTTYMSNWHPLSWLSHMLDVTLFGLEPGSHHLMNVFIHLLNTFLLYIIFLRMTGKQLQSATVAALFALHPLHVQSVVWVAERKDLLSTMFFMLTVIAYLNYLKNHSLKWYLSVILIYILGLACKPMIVTLPFVLWLLDYWPLKRYGFKLNTPGRKVAAYSFGDKMPLLMLSAASSVITIVAQQSGGAMASLGEIGLKARLVNAVFGYTMYLRKIIWPDNIAIVYPYPEHLSSWAIVYSCVCILGTSMLSFWSIKKRPWLAVGWLWFVGTLVPVIGIVQVGMQSMADRYTYIPAIGIFVMVSWGMIAVMEEHSFNNKWMFALLIMLLFVYSSVTWKQIGYWRNSETLFRHTIDVTEKNYIAHNNLGYELLEKGDLDNAIRHLSRAIEIKPEFEVAHLNLGIAFSKTGNIEKAKEQYKIAIQMKPDYPEAYSNLGNVYYREGKYREAVTLYTRALGLKPDFVEAYNNMAAAMIQLGDNKKAIELFQNALRIDPDNRNMKRNLKMLLSLKQ